ncbi:TIGR04211 family SH3 domain-containing protein [uncultured Ferrimonas sp.]|uniref:TIGR04211 family SH3 domain-containing protein n=1 Tax=uncultured Ferrimonas sp. TaxID=432640 RepID=UPI0026043558|nr:TIGR04211 family SH3 domain-containing protein [uncultured Ferrimonas sp.]
MLKRISLALLALVSLSASAAELTITEDINVYLLAGPSNKYRILGTIRAGDAVKPLNEVSGDYSKVEDGKARQGWVLTRNLANKASFRTLLPQAQQQLSATQAQLEQTKGELALLTQRYDNDQQASTSSLQAQRQRVEQQAIRINELEQSNAALTEQMNSMQNSERFVWLKQGGLIAGIGLLVGLIVPFLPRPSRRRKDHNYIR